MSILGFTLSMITVWVIVAVLFIIIEAMTMGLTTIWFAGGAIVALVIALLGGGTILQVCGFVVVSLLLLIFTRKILVDKLHMGKEKTNVDALVGRKGIVTSEIKPLVPGTINVWGQSWTAISRNEALVINVNEEVQVVSVEGVKAIVEPIKVLD